MKKFGEDSGKIVFVLPVIRGLESERPRVRKAIEESGTGIIGLSISEEELKGLEEFDGDDAPPANFEEDVYITWLSNFGEVSKPPPCFVEARDIAKEKGLGCVALDMSDEEYTEAYVNSVSTIEMMLQSRGEGRLRRRQFLAETPLEFVREFDSVVNARKGFRQLENRRENHIASRLGELVKEHGTVLGIIEAERATGVGQALSRYLPR